MEKALQKTRKLMLLLCLMIVPLGMTSCGDDPDPDPDSSTNIVGTWRTSDGSETYVFNSNGTGRWTEVDNGYERTLSFGYTYSEADHQIIIVYDASDEIENYIVQLTGKTMMFYRGNTLYYTLYRQ